MSGFGGIAKAIGFVSAAGSAARTVSSLLNGDISGGTLNLGGIAFRDEDLPREMRTPAMQRIKKHVAPGGAVVLNAMGVDYGPIAWEGLFYGSDALDKTNALKAMLEGAEVQELTWFDQLYDVLVEEFEPRYSETNVIRYRIKCVILADENSGISTDPTAEEGVFGSIASGAQSVKDAISTVQQIAGAVGGVTASVGISIPLLGEMQGALGVASVGASAAGSLSAGTQAFATNIGGIGAAVSFAADGITTAASSLASATGLFGAATAAGSAVKALATAGDAAAALAGLSQGGAYAGLAAANAAAAAGTALSPRGH